MKYLCSWNILEKLYAIVDFYAFNGDWGIVGRIIERLMIRVA